MCAGMCISCALPSVSIVAHTKCDRLTWVNCKSLSCSMCSPRLTQMICFKTLNQNVLCCRSWATVVDHTSLPLSRIGRICVGKKRNFDWMTMVFRYQMTSQNRWKQLKLWRVAFRFLFRTIDHRLRNSQDRRVHRRLRIVSLRLLILLDEQKVHSHLKQNCFLYINLVKTNNNYSSKYNPSFSMTSHQCSVSCRIRSRYQCGSLDLENSRHTASTWSKVANRRSRKKCSIERNKS